MPKTFWLCLCVGGIGIQVDWSRFYISSLSPHHRQQHLHHPYPGPPSLLCHSHFQRCLVSLTPVMVPLPFSMVQERRREAPAHHHRVPRGPSLACSSCCSIQLLLSIRPRPAGLGNSVRAEPLWLRASHLPRCLFVGSTTGDSGSISSCSASPFLLTRSDYGRGTSGPGMCPVPVAFPAQPGTSSCPGRLPIILQVLLCHATVSGGGQNHQHSGIVTPREWERDGNVSMTDPCLLSKPLFVWSGSELFLDIFKASFSLFSSQLAQQRQRCF